MSRSNLDLELDDSKLALTISRWILAASACLAVGVLGWYIFAWSLNLVPDSSMRKVDIGMHKFEVQRLLGTPADHYDGGWQYHRRSPFVGPTTVYFDADDRVINIVY